MPGISRSEPVSKRNVMQISKIISDVVSSKLGVPSDRFYLNVSLESLQAQVQVFHTDTLAELVTYPLRPLGMGSSMPYILKAKICRHLSCKSHPEQFSLHLNREAINNAYCQLVNKVSLVRSSMMQQDQMLAGRGAPLRDAVTGTYESG